MPYLFTLNNGADGTSNVKDKQKIDDCKAQIRKLQFEKNVPEFPRTDRVDKWWQIFLKGKGWVELESLLKACLSIFSGPRVESSFSMMNSIITSKTNSLHTESYAAIQSVKYFLLKKGKSSIEYFHREDPHYDEVDLPLIDYMLKARQRDKKTLADAQQTKQQHRKSYNLQAPHRHPKVKVHDLTLKAVSMMRKRRLIKTKSATGLKRKSPEDLLVLPSSKRIKSQTSTGSLKIAGSGKNKKNSERPACEILIC